MAIIKPSNKFEGSELNLNSSGTPYLKDGVRRALFNKTNNPQGAYVYFLPAYKADRHGNGVWYKKIYVRDNFGTSYKEKYFVANRENDPAEYFGNNFRALYPEESKIKEADKNGKKWKQYPNYGRVTERVLYNVAFAQSLEEGAHVLDLPLRNGADSLMAYVDGKDIRGNPRPPINDPDRSIPVFLMLKENTANPWVIQVENSNPVQLPVQLADSDYLYNLEDILVVKSTEEILSKLRDMYSSDVFDECMDGFPGLTRSSSPKRATHTSYQETSDRDYDEYDEVLPPVRPAAPKVLPPVNIPKATVAPAVIPNNLTKTAMEDITTAVQAPPVADISALPANPMSRPKMSREEALRFINEQ